MPPEPESNTPNSHEVEAAEAIVRAEWLNSVDTAAILDYGSQDAVHAAMTHMRDAIAQALADQRVKTETLRVTRSQLRDRIATAFVYHGHTAAVGFAAADAVLAEDATLDAR